MAGSGCCDGRSCPICTWCFHRCSASIPTILIYCRPLFSPSAVMGDFQKSFWSLLNHVFPKNKQKQTNIVDSTSFGPREKSGREKIFPGLVQIESTAHRWFWICTRTRKFFSCPDFFEGQSKWKRHLVLLRVFQVHLVATFTESYLLQRFWREGWIFNIQKLIGTNTAPCKAGSQ